MNKLILTTCLLVISLSASARSEISSYRCGNNLIQLGEYTYDVQETCGEPDGFYEWQKEKYQHGRRIVINYERWTYSDYGKRDVHIIFRNGIISTIQQGKR